MAILSSMNSTKLTAQTDMLQIHQCTSSAVHGYSGGGGQSLDGLTIHRPGYGYKLSDVLRADCRLDSTHLTAVSGDYWRETKIWKDYFYT